MVTVFLDTVALIHHEFVLQRITVNGVSYLGVMKYIFAPACDTYQKKTFLSEQLAMLNAHFTQPVKQFLA